MDHEALDSKQICNLTSFIESIDVLN